MFKNCDINSLFAQFILTFMGYLYVLPKVSDPGTTTAEGSTLTLNGYNKTELSCYAIFEPTIKLAFEHVFGRAKLLDSLQSPSILN